MVKVYDIGTFRMGARGGHFAIVVLSALGRLTMVVSSTIPAWDASVNNCGVVQDDRREPPRIEGHRPGPLGILSDQDSLLATTARCQWRSATGSPSNRPLSIHGPSKSRAATSVTSRSIRVRSFCKDRLDRPEAHGKRVFYRRGARSALTSRVVRIRRAGCSRDRRLAGDSGIDHQLLGSGRRRFTIHKVWPAAEKGYPYDGPVDLGCSQAPSRGLSSP